MSDDEEMCRKDGNPCVWQTHVLTPDTVEHVFGKPHGDFVKGRSEDRCAKCGRVRPERSSA